MHRRLLSLVALAPVACSAFTIELDYSYDTGTFLSENPVAQAALAAAAADLSAVLTNTLNPIASDTFTGTNASTTVTVNWALNFSDPATGNNTSLETFSLAADTFRVFVGNRTLAGSTLGVGGHAGSGFSLGATGFLSELPLALDAAEANSNTALTRGLAAPRFAEFVGDFNGSPYSFSVGPVAGSLSFDNDADWHFDHTTPVEAGKADFYSVALHEILHTLGIGTSTTWNDLVSGTDWLGAEAIAVHGTGTDLIDEGGAHIAPDTMSTSFGGGVAQEVAMDPTITAGTRKYLTELDLAFLRDLGYETLSPIPEPSAYASLAGLAILGFTLRRRPRRA